MAGIEQGRGAERKVADGELREVSTGVTMVTVSGLGSSMNDPNGTHSNQ